MTQNLPYRFLNVPEAQQKIQLERFKGVCALYGYEGFLRLQNAHAIVIGNGGVGSWIAECLVRTGVGRITLIDFDTIELSNTNRQIHTLTSTVSSYKAEVLGERLKDINPFLILETVTETITRSNVKSIIARAIDMTESELIGLDSTPLNKLLDPNDLAAQKLKQCYGGPEYAKRGPNPQIPGNIFVAEAIDDLFAKAAVVDYLHRLQIPLVVSGGAGGRIDPFRLRSTEITSARGDQLIKRLRTELRRNHGYPKGSDDKPKPKVEGEVPTKGRKKLRPPEERFNILCTFSDEKPMRSKDRLGFDASPTEFGLKDTPELPKFGASMSVTATAGLYIASIIIRWIVGSRA